MGFNINPKTIATPVAAFTMVFILYAYARSSIHSAKRNARLHREADGGQISWHNESLRRHGQLERVEQKGPMSALFGKSDTGEPRKTTDMQAYLSQQKKLENAKGDIKKPLDGGSEAQDVKKK